jgi:hypothetical protein
MRTPAEQFVPWLPGRAPVLACVVLLLLAGAPAQATEYDAGTPITDVSITNPTANEVWLIGTPHTLTCTTATDTDRACDGGDWYDVDDSVTHYWTGSGTFKNNDNIGTSVDYICINTVGSDTVTVYADDNYDPDNNAAIVDESPTSDSETVSIVGLEVHKVGFGNDHALYRTPTTFYGWGDGTTAITDPVYNADDTAEEKAAKNHACFTKGAANATLTAVQCRTPVALTEGSGFSLRALGTDSWAWAAFAIAAGNRESGTGTLSLDNDTLATAVTRYAGSYSCAWRYCCFSGAAQEVTLNSTSHSVYLTWDTPSPGGTASTVKRVDAACGWANTATTAKGTADGVHTNMPKIRFGHTQPEVDDWRLFIDKSHEVAGHTDPCDPTATFRGECDEYARLMKRALDMLGLINSVPYLTYASRDATVTDRESKLHTDSRRYWLKFDFGNTGTVNNNFEGSLRVPIGGGANHYYAVVPTLNASSEKGLLRQIGPDSYGAVQRWIRADNNDTTEAAFYTAWPPDPQLPGTEPYPN